MRITLGVVIAIVLIFYWYQKDRGQPLVPPVKQGVIEIVQRVA